jgi:hypothetical protein
MPSCFGTVSDRRIKDGEVGARKEHRPGGEGMAGRMSGAHGDRPIKLQSQGQMWSFVQRRLGEDGGRSGALRTNFRLLSRTLP